MVTKIISTLAVFGLLMLCPCTCNAQKYDNYWTFGDSAGIDFTDINNPKYFNAIKEYLDLLLSAYRQTQEGILSIEDHTKIREQAQAILDQAKAQHPPPEPPLPGHRGRVRGQVRKPKARNLIERFEKYSHQVWLFITGRQIPFDNNQAERDIRMLKTMQKVKGCF